VCILQCPTRVLYLYHSADEPQPLSLYWQPRNTLTSHGHCHSVFCFLHTEHCVTTVALSKRLFWESIQHWTAKKSGTLHVTIAGTHSMNSQRNSCTRDMACNKCCNLIGGVRHWLNRRNARGKGTCDKRLLLLLLLLLL